MKKVLILFLIIIGLFANIETATAETSVTDEEKAVFAFFKMTDQKPKLESWIKNSKRYLDGRKAEKDKIYNEERERLDWGFGVYDYEKDFITIRRDIRLSTLVDQNGVRHLKTRFVDDRHNETPYFPIEYGKESIAFIVEGLENYRSIKPQPEEIPKIKKYFHDSAPYEAVLEVRIRPLSADSKNKLFVDYRDQWLMLGDIAYLKIDFYDEFKLEHVVVWDYNAPWYLDESKKALMEMFKEPKEE
ncbi:MAG: hypothetical protein AB8B83_02985 [Bdellovibrionales bacterium]